jgi:hypothetical protein
LVPVGAAIVAVGLRVIEPELLLLHDTVPLVMLVTVTTFVAVAAAVTLAFAPERLKKQEPKIVAPHRAELLLIAADRFSASWVVFPLR